MSNPVVAAIIISAVLQAGTAYMGQKAQTKAANKRAREAAAARERAEAIQKRRDDVQASRQKRQAVAEARRYRAQAVNLAANRGAGGAIGAPGSTVPAVAGNIQSQLNFNNAFINQVTALNQGIRSAFNEAQTIANRPISAGSGMMALSGLFGAAGQAASSDAGGKYINSFFSS
tara:strand:+ start:472 stop:993 length:522 start_codon:yes stop_codon:yes gene_type:complete